MDVDPPPGIPNIKKVELFEKFRPLLPQQCRDETCPHPGQDVIEDVKGTKNEKSRNRAAETRKRKKISSTESIDVVASDGLETSVDVSKSSGPL